VNVFLVEPYFSGSHKAWAMGLQKHSQYDVALITHEGVYWRWRMSGSAATLATEIVEQAKRVKPDLLIVSSMTNLAELKGLLPKELGSIPTALYMHENQLGYPLSPNQDSAKVFAFKNWMSMLAADKIFVNSNFHLDQLHQELPKFLSRTPPDYQHHNFIDETLAKTSVLYPGVELSWAKEKPNFATKSVPTVLWNQRWEFDKSQEQIFDTFGEIAKENLDFELILLGENQRPLEKASKHHEILATRARHVGYASREQYLALLKESDIVVGDPLHEYFGISIIEALAAGAYPVLPDGLSYPEILTEKYNHILFQSGSFKATLVNAIEAIDKKLKMVEGLDSEMMRFDWSNQIQNYDTELEKLVG